MSESGPARPGRSAERKTEDAVLRSLTDVAMVQAADFAELHDVPLDGSSIGLGSGASLLKNLLVEREVGARATISTKTASWS